MKRFSFIFLVLQFFLMPCLWAQVAKIIETEGVVSVRENERATWQPARVDMYLEKKTEIKTGIHSRCSLAFDEELQNILTIKENSHIKIEDVRPGKIFLPKGRIFSLIEDIAKLQTFEVRTPVAVVGVRGTGDSVEHTWSQTVVKCFEGEIFVSSVDRRGRTRAEKTLYKGRGLDIGKDGALKDMFDIRDSDLYEWMQFKDEVGQVRHERLGRRGVNTPPLDIYEPRDDQHLKDRYLLDTFRSEPSEPLSSEADDFYDSDMGKKAMEYQPPQKEHQEPPQDHPQEYFDPGQPEPYHQEPPLHDAHIKDDIHYDKEREPATTHQDDPVHFNSDSFDTFDQEHMENIKDDMFLDIRRGVDDGGGYP